MYPKWDILSSDFEMCAEERGRKEIEKGKRQDRGQKEIGERLQDREERGNRAEKRGRRAEEEILDYSMGAW